MPISGIFFNKKEPKPKLDAIVIKVIVGNIIPKSEKFPVFKKIAETGIIINTLAFDISVVNR